MGRRALIAVKDASGVAALGGRLVEAFGFELLANESAGNALREKGIPFEALLEGEGVQRIAEKDKQISLVIANFLDVETAARGFMSWKSAMAAFDRSIVELIRAAAWAADRVAVGGNQSDYGRLLEAMEEGGGKVPQSLRLELATRALRAVSEFDYAVAQYLEIHGADVPDMGALSGYPKAQRFAWPRAAALKEGENAHQQAALYGSFFEHFEQLQGEALDYLSVLNVSRAAYLIGEFEKPAAAVLRRGKLVWARCAASVDMALQSLFDEDDLSDAWLVTNGSTDAQILDTLIQKGLAGMLLPDATLEVQECCAETPGLRLMISKSGLGYEALQEVRSVIGGVLVQDKDRAAINPMEWSVLSLAQPLVEDWESLLFAAKVARHVDSLSCVCVNEQGIVALEQGRASLANLWRSTLSRGVDLANAAGVFDHPIESPELLIAMKEAGLRLVLSPAGPQDEALRAVANEIGLVLIVSPRAWRRY